LLPGLDGTGLLFRPLLAALPSELRAKVIGYPANEALGLPDLAALVARQLPAEGAVLVAESFSGLVALTLLANAPPRIWGVIFVGAFAEPPRPLLLRLAPLALRHTPWVRRAPAFLLRQYCVGKDASASELKMLREAMACVSPEILGHRLRLVAVRHTFGKGPIEIPAYYIRASQDRLVPAACTHWFQQRFRKCEVLDAEGPHFLLQVKPRDSAEMIGRIVGSLNGA
jgi:pimeloyl-[acyl-carrier protein] methyl ester esterase